MASDSTVSQPGGQGSPIYIPNEQDCRLYTQALGSIFVASYDLQGYGGGIRTRLHTGFSLINPVGTDFIVIYKIPCLHNHAALQMEEKAILSVEDLR
jgi:hypothetical protein